jgi:hypothetical protein
MAILQAWTMGSKEQIAEVSANYLMHQSVAFGARWW